MMRWALALAMFCGVGCVAAGAQMTPLSPDGSLFPDTAPHRRDVSPYVAGQERALRDGMAAARSDTRRQEMLEANRTPRPGFVWRSMQSSPGQNVLTLRRVAPGTVVHFTTDGTPATVDSPVYEQPIVVQGRVKVRAIAVREGHEPSYEVAVTFRQRR